MRSSDIICPKCKAGYRRIEVASGRGTKGEYRCLLCDHVLEVYDGSAEWPSVSRSNVRRPLSKDCPRGDYLPLLRGSLIGTCPEVLSTRGHPSGLVRLMSTSRTRKNFSASMHRL